MENNNNLTDEVKTMFGTFVDKASSIIKPPEGASANPVGDGRSRKRRSPRRTIKRKKRRAYKNRTRRRRA
jgi:hypothetical protein